MSDLAKYCTLAVFLMLMLVLSALAGLHFGCKCTLDEAGVFEFSQQQQSVSPDWVEKGLRRMEND